MRNRILGLVAFGAIMFACFAGILHMTLWAAVASACGLALVSVSNHVEMARALSGSRDQIGAILIATSITNGAATALTAFATGHGIGWIWGV